MPFPNRTAADLKALEPLATGINATWTVPRHQACTLLVTGWKKAAAGPVADDFAVVFSSGTLRGQYTAQNSIYGRFPGGARLRTEPLHYNWITYFNLVPPDEGAERFLLVECFDHAENAVSASLKIDVKGDSGLNHRLYFKVK
jgi:hypothetical protein